MLMYDAQTTKNRIKQLCKSVGVSEDKLLTDCQLGVNAIRQINDKKGMSSFSLARIADYLNCSVDYLLGRTERPDEVLSDSGSLEDCQQQSSKNGFNIVITHSEISIDVSEHEFVSIKKYRDLDDHGKTVVDMLITEETARMKRDSLTTVETEELWQYDEPVSAGDGTILGYMSGHKVVKAVSNTYTRKADFIVSVRGSSMEPRFYDNDLILVQETDDIEYGEVGIWYLDGRSYVKQKGHGRLISLNEMYRDVYMEEFSECRCQGRVIGTLDPDWIVEE